MVLDFRLRTIRIKKKADGEKGCHCRGNHIADKSRVEVKDDIISKDTCQPCFDRTLSGGAQKNNDTVISWERRQLLNLFHGVLCALPGINPTGISKNLCIAEFLCLCRTIMAAGAFDKAAVDNNGLVLIFTQ